MRRRQLTICIDEPHSSPTHYIVALLQRTRAALLEIAKPHSPGSLFECGPGDAGTSQFLRTFDDWEAGMRAAFTSTKEYSTRTPRCSGADSRGQVAGKERAAALHQEDAMSRFAQRPKPMKCQLKCLTAGRVPVRLGALELNRCDTEFMEAIVDHIGPSPSLKSLKVLTASEAFFTDELLAALDANPCQLDELHVALLACMASGISDPRHLHRLLDSSPIRGISSLTLRASYGFNLDDACACFSQRIESGGADSRQGPAFVPNLCRLAILIDHKCISPVLPNHIAPSYAAICTLQEARKSVLKELVMTGLPAHCEEDGPEVKNLRDLGLEVRVVRLDELELMDADSEEEDWDVRSNVSEEA
ncbi:F-box domain-containing protein [Mycena chlorophos]|uniref:F-box domain-containing protein n=1 Tax=Mycena chlorophos TaxID=658473 RepID=A0A8H6VPQ8_MYCCL|nr:F-box domain-containing protein [Mycena chlorophos]